MVWVIALVVLLLIGAFAMAQLRAPRREWGSTKPGETWDSTGRLVEPMEEEFEKPRDEGDLL